MSVPNYLPDIIAPQMHKGEFCYCTGLSRYKLTNILHANADKLARLGYHKYDKILMPNVVRWLCDYTGLAIDFELFCQCYAPKSVFK